MTGNMDYNNGNRLGRTEQGLCAENCLDEDIFVGIGMALVKEELRPAAQETRQSLLG